MKKLSYFTISFLFHGAFIGAAFLFIADKTAPTPIQLEVVTAVESKPTQTLGSKHPAGSQVKRSVSDPNYAGSNDLGRKILMASGSSFDPEAARRAGSSLFSAALNDNQFYSEAEGNLFGENDNWAFHQQVFKRVDSELIFDAILARYNHFGVVYLEFSVDQKGYLLEKTMRASAQNSILKVHAVRALRKALDEEFEPTKWSVLEKPVVFRAKFEFTHENPNLNFKKQNAFSDPVFIFRRSTNASDVATFRPADQGFDNIGDVIDYEQTLKKLKNRQRNRVLRAGDFDPFMHYKTDSAYTL